MMSRRHDIHFLTSKNSLHKSQLMNSSGNLIVNRLSINPLVAYTRHVSAPLYLSENMLSIRPHRRPSDCKFSPDDSCRLFSEQGQQKSNRSRSNGNPPVIDLQTVSSRYQKFRARNIGRDFVRSSVHRLLNTACWTQLQHFSSNDLCTES